MTGPDGRTPLDVVNAVLLAAEERNVDRYLANYHENAVMRLKDGRVLSGKEQIRERFVEFAASGVSRKVTIHHDLTILGKDVAMVCGAYTMQMNSGNAVEETRGTSHDVLTRTADGTWLIAIDHPYEQWPGA